ncbi:MAG: hypothetical protein IJC18_05425, partial [Clostridia bacterium]|nr:hypothetical protein [Clostridia bacterium]
VRGAAIATVISRFVELAVIAIATHCQAGRYTFIRGAYRSMYIPWNIVRDIIRKGLPLTVNEVLWAVSIAMINQCYSMRGIAAVAGINICTTVSNLFNSVFFSMGAVIAIMVGRELGANKIEEARSTAAKLIAFSVMLSTGVGIVIAVTAPYISLIYNTSDEVRAIATGADANGRDTHALYGTYALVLFRNPLGRQDGHHLPLRQRIHAGRVCTARICALAMDIAAHCAALSALSGTRAYKERARYYHRARRLVG